MTRNMFKRIECLFPIEDADLKNKIVGDILPAMLRDNSFSSALHPNGAYYKTAEMKNSEPFSCQRYFERGRGGA
jgi:polyphosphate kinase